MEDPGRLYGGGEILGQGWKDGWGASVVEKGVGRRGKSWRYPWGGGVRAGRGTRAER